MPEHRLQRHIAKAVFLIMLLALLVCLHASLSYANSAPPPSVVIVVPDAPGDLEVTIGDAKASRIDKVVESYFVFRFLDLTDHNIRVKTADKDFAVVIETPRRYNNVFTLDLEHQTLTPGRLLWRTAALAALAVVLTLIIEGIVFYLFGFRKRKSWLIFLVVNLVTQGALNALLSGAYTPWDGYGFFSLIFPLVILEIVVLLAEVLAFMYLIDEHSGCRTSLYVVTANLLSLIAGAYLITTLPL